ncbi:MAG: tRNA lysidine(34) synthetase TilS [Opitutales bacterium]|nr:tRNA lysidine(34) synthetase TilS [Opitutales bacterium]
MRLPTPDALRAAASRLPRLPSAPTSSGPVAVAVSGGADSVYLLCGLWADEALRPRLRVLHFDHRVRGEVSADDARFVAALCAALDVPCALGSREGQGAASEAELRAARDAFFASQRQALGCDLLCTAHHLDDVVENALLRLARGAGLAGLAAPRALQEFRDGHRRWRPLIEAGITKSALLGELRGVGIPWREDASNSLPIAARNRVRAWLADGGDAALGLGYAEGFARSAGIVGEAQEALATWARELGCVVSSAGLMPVGPLKGRPEALAQECLREFLHRHGIIDPSPLSLRPLTAALVAGDEAQSAVRGVVVRVKGGELSVLTEVPSFGSAERRLRIGSADDECGLLAEVVDVDASLWASLSRGDISPAREVYVVAPPTTLTWRGRRAGDRYQPLGSPGSAKLSDLLINRKIPAEQREALPVVLSARSILWVPGVPPASFARLEGPARGALRLTWLGPCLG